MLVPVDASWNQSMPVGTSRNLSESFGASRIPPEPSPLWLPMMSMDIEEKEEEKRAWDLVWEHKEDMDS